MYALHKYTYAVHPPEILGIQKVTSDCPFSDVHLRAVLVDLALRTISCSPVVCIRKGVRLYACEAVRVDRFSVPKVNAARTHVLGEIG